jgi:hypothetical protein
MQKQCWDELRGSRPEPVLCVQVKVNKELCFESERRQAHVDALVGGLVASSGNELLSTALIEAAAALVAEPEMATTSEIVRTCVPCWPERASPVCHLSHRRYCSRGWPGGRQWQRPPQYCPDRSSRGACSRARDGHHLRCRLHLWPPPQMSAPVATTSDVCFPCPHAQLASRQCCTKRAAQMSCIRIFFKGGRSVEFCFFVSHRA